MFGWCGSGEQGSTARAGLYLRIVDLTVSSHSRHPKWVCVPRVVGQDSGRKELWTDTTSGGGLSADASCATPSNTRHSLRDADGDGYDFHRGGTVPKATGAFAPPSPFDNG